MHTHRLFVGAALVLFAAACSSPASPESSSDSGGETATSETGAFDCAPQESSDISGIAISFSTTACTFTMAQAAAGISMPYSIVIDSNWTGIVLTPDPYDESRHDNAIAPSGLHLFEMLSGGDQRYCLCDTGLPSPPGATAHDLVKGTYAGVFHWDGRNWGGPSDTSTAEGAPFPVGVYQLEVRAFGSAPIAGGSAPFTVKASINVRLVP